MTIFFVLIYSNNFDSKCYSKRYVIVNNNSSIEDYINSNNISNIIRLLVEYLEYRKSIKLPNTNTVIDGLLDFLKPYSKVEQEKIIKKAIKNGWKDFYPLESKKGDNDGTEYRRI